MHGTAIVGRSAQLAMIVANLFHPESFPYLFRLSERLYTTNRSVNKINESCGDALEDAFGGQKSFENLELSVVLHNASVLKHQPFCNFN